MHIRKALEKDIDAVYCIEQEQFPHPWKKKFLVSELSNNLAYFYVSEEKQTKEIAGYIIFWIIEETLELHDIGVKGTFRKRGVGRRLMEKMLERAAQRGVEEMFLEVRRSNKNAIRFYEAFGFKQVGERKNYYGEPVEDALVYKSTRPF